MYFVRTGNTPKNLYTEYMFVDGKWEIIGSTSSQEIEKLKADLEKNLTQLASKFTSVVTKKDLRNELKDYIVKEDLDPQVNHILDYNNYARFKVLPTSMLPAKGENNVLYLKPKSRTEKNNFYEYIWVDRTNTFELIGARDIDTSAFELKVNAKKKYAEIQKTTTRLENWVKDAYNHEQTDIKAVRADIEAINKEIAKKLSLIKSDTDSIISITKPDEKGIQTISIARAENKPDSVDVYGEGYVTGEQVSKIYHSLHSSSITFKFVKKLPAITKELLTQENKYVYLSPSKVIEPGTDNVKNVLTEYILIIAYDEAGNPSVKGSYYEKIGEVGFDSSLYYTKEEIDNIVTGINDDIANVESIIENTKNELVEKIDSVDDNVKDLASKTIQAISVEPTEFINIKSGTNVTEQIITVQKAELNQNKFSDDSTGIPAANDVQKAIDEAAGKAESAANSYTDSLLGQGFSATDTVEIKLAEKINTIVIAEDSRGLLDAVKSGTEYTVSAAPAEINNGILSGAGYVSGIQANTAISEAIKTANTYTDSEIKKHHQYANADGWEFPNPEIHYFYKAAADIENNELIIEAADISKLNDLYIKNTIVIDNFGGAERTDFTIRLSNDEDTVIYRGIIPEDCILNVNTFYMNMHGGKLGINCEVWEHFES